MVKVHSYRRHTRRREDPLVRVPHIPMEEILMAERAMVREEAMDIACKKPHGQVAFTGVIHESTYAVGMAEKDVVGYTPVIFQTEHGRMIGTFPSYDAASEYAEEMNAELGLAPREAMLVIMSSMRKRNPD